MRCHGLQAASLVSMLLQTLTGMAGNAHISKRIIAGLAAHAHGRAGLRLGASAWMARETQSYLAEPGSKAALQWAVSRLWQLSESHSRLPLHASYGLST